MPPRKDFEFRISNFPPSRRDTCTARTNLSGVSCGAAVPAAHAGGTPALQGANAFGSSCGAAVPATHAGGTPALQGANASGSSCGAAVPAAHAGGTPALQGRRPETPVGVALLRRASSREGRRSSSPRDSILQHRRDPDEGIGTTTPQPQKSARRVSSPALWISESGL
jgi:hypothetical protein